MRGLGSQKAEKKSYNKRGEETAKSETGRETDVERGEEVEERPEERKK